MAIVAAWICTFALQAVGARVTIEERLLHHRTRIEVTAVAENDTTINNPLSWPQIEWVVPDGSWVAEGDEIVRFDTTGPSNELSSLLLRQAVTDADVKGRLTNLDNRNLDLSDRLEALRDELAVAEARRQRLLALPDADDVALAEGRLHVERLGYGAASNDLARAHERVELGFLSPAALERHMDRHQEAAARVRHVETLLALAAQPAPALDLERVELDIDNLRLDVAHQQARIEQSDALLDIERSGARSRAERSQRRIDEQQRDLLRTSMQAPLSGFVSYLRQFRQRVLESGDKMSRGFAFLRLPDLGSLVFRGTLPENERRFFDVGDRVTVTLAGFGDREVAATLTSISSLGRDLGEHDGAGGGGGGQREYGLKVYDVTIRPESVEPWMRLGAGGVATIIAAESLSGATIPMTYVTYLDGQPSIFLDGRPTPVDGEKVGAFFLFSDIDLLGRTVTKYPGEDVSEFNDEVDASGVSVLFETSGELEPMSSVDVTVDRIYRWQQIVWLVAEDSVVTSGAVVARLDTEETDEQIRDSELRLDEAVSNRETHASNLELNERERIYQLSRASNLVRIAEIDLESTLYSLDARAISEASLQMSLTRIAHDAALRHQERVLRRDPEWTSAEERRQAGQAVERAALRLEAAEARLAVLREGTDALERERAKMALEAQRRQFDLLEKRATYDAFRDRINVSRAKRWEGWAQRRLNQRLRWRDNLELRAPADGLVRYRRVWGQGGMRKIEVGQEVGHYFTLIQIADVSNMIIRADVPEPFFDVVRAGMPVRVEVAATSRERLKFDGKVQSVDFLFRDKRSRDAQRGLYSNFEPLGETVFSMVVSVGVPKGVTLKPGSMARISVPDPDGETP